MMWFDSKGKVGAWAIFLEHYKSYYTFRELPVLYVQFD